MTNYDNAHSQLEHEVDGFTTDLLLEGIKILSQNHELRNNLEIEMNQRAYGNRKELDKLYELF